MQMDSVVLRSLAAGRRCLSRCERTTPTARALVDACMHPVFPSGSTGVVVFGMVCRAIHWQCGRPVDGAQRKVLLGKHNSMEAFRRLLTGKPFEKGRMDDAGLPPPLSVGCGREVG